MEGCQGLELDVNAAAAVFLFLAERNCLLCYEMKSHSLPLVLLVEDHDEYRSLAVLALEMYLAGQARVAAVAGVSEALQLLATERVELVISDVLLEDGGARAFLDAAAAWLSTGGKVILLSNHEPAALGGLLERPGVVAFASKVDGLAALAELVRFWMKL